LRNPAFSLPLPHIQRITTKQNPDYKTLIILSAVESNVIGRRGGGGARKEEKKNPPHTYIYVPSVASKQITCNTHTHTHTWMGDAGEEETYLI
jgi:hypothetical protein